MTNYPGISGGWLAVWTWYSVDADLGIEIQDLLAFWWWEGLGEEVLWKEWVMMGPSPGILRELGPYRPGRLEGEPSGMEADHSPY